MTRHTQPTLQQRKAMTETATAAVVLKIASALVFAPNPNYSSCRLLSSEFLSFASK